MKINWVHSTGLVAFLASLALSFLSGNVAFALTGMAFAVICTRMSERMDPALTTFRM